MEHINRFDFNFDVSRKTLLGLYSGFTKSTSNIGSYFLSLIKSAGEWFTSKGRPTNLNKIKPIPKVEQSSSFSAGLFFDLCKDSLHLERLETVVRGHFLSNEVLYSGLLNAMKFNNIDGFDAILKNTHFSEEELLKLAKTSMAENKTWVLRSIMQGVLFKNEAILDLFFYAFSELKDKTMAIDVLRYNQLNQDRCIMLVISRAVVRRNLSLIQLIVSANIVTKLEIEDVWITFLDIFINEGRDLESLKFLVENNLVLGRVKSVFFNRALMNKDNDVVFIFLNNYQKETESFWSFVLMEAVTFANAGLIEFIFSEDRGLRPEELLKAYKKAVMYDDLEVIKVFLKNLEIPNHVAYESTRALIVSERLEVLKLFFEHSNLSINQKERLVSFAATSYRYSAFEKCLRFLSPDLGGTQRLMRTIGYSMNERLESIFLNYQIEIVK